MKVYILVLVILISSLTYIGINSFLLFESDNVVFVEKGAVLEIRVEIPDINQLDSKNSSFLKSNSDFKIKNSVLIKEVSQSYRQNVVLENTQAITFGPIPASIEQPNEDEEILDQNHYYYDEQSIVFGPEPVDNGSPEESIELDDQSVYDSQSITFGPEPIDAVVIEENSN